MFSFALLIRQTAVSASCAVAVGGVVVGCGSGDNRATAESIFDKCQQGPSSNFELSPDKKAIDFKLFAGTESSEATYNCLLEETGAPSSVDYRMKETRPIDGTQEAEWQGWKMYWNYEGRGEGVTIHLSEA